MVGLAHKITDAYEEIMEQRDPRLDGWFLMSSIWPTLTLTSIYILGATVVGPKLMEKREPFQLKSVLIVYNFLLVIMSSYLFIEFGLSGWFVGFSVFKCEPVDYSNSPLAMRMITVGYLFYILKFIEYSDTVFFVMRKKFNQVSFLHVFHHSAMAIMWWLGVRFAPGGHGSFHGMLNSFIHVIMYTYYGLSAMGPAYRKYLWWKKYVTTIQMVQFVGIFLHGLNIFRSDCTYPTFIGCAILFYSSVFLVMFGNFYRKMYTQRPKPTSVKNGNVTSEIRTNGIERNGVHANGCHNGTSNKKEE